jgi:hypothetical protein
MLRVRLWSWMSKKESWKIQFEEGELNRTAIVAI